MINEAAERHKAARGERAKALLDNDLLKEAFSVLETAYIETWRATLVHDQASRERLFLAVNIVGKVRDHLGKVLSDGALSQAELRKLERDYERKKLLGIV